MKRNVKESIRHRANSLAREGHHWTVSVPDDAEAFDTALDDLLTLHRARAGLAAKTHHPDYFTSRADRAFLRDVGHAMFRAGHASPCLLRINDAPAAGRLLLHANDTTYFSFSGFDPQWWPYNVATTLMAACLERAIERGARLAHLSLGPDVAKLRWSEQLQLHQDFLIVGARRRSRLAFALFWQLRATTLVHRERRRHRRV